MSRLTSPILASLLGCAAIALAGCPSPQTTATTTPTGGNEPVHTEPNVAPVPVAPAPRLTDVEKDHIDGLVMAMYVDDIEVRRLAAEELGTIGADAREALPELIRCAAAFDHEDEPVASCAHSIVMMVDGADPHAITALVFDFQLPLEIKERALAALGELGGLATAAIASIYLDACNRGPSATTTGAASHLERTAKLALDQLARSPASARAYLGDDQHGTCGATGVDAVTVIAKR